MSELTDKQIDEYEKVYGIKLMDYQREVLKRLSSADKPVTINMVAFAGRTYLRNLAETAKIILGLKESED